MIDLLHVVMPNRIRPLTPDCEIEFTECRTVSQALSIAVYFFNLRAPNN